LYIFYFFSSIQETQDVFIGKAAKVTEPKNRNDEYIQSGNAATSEIQIDKTLIIKGVRFVFENEGGREIVKVLPETDIRPPRKIDFKYEWSRNGQPAGDGAFIAGYKRGDKISVSITPFDGDRTGEKRVAEIEIKNKPPEIRDSKGVEMTGNSLSYRVNAIDPDGDAISYSLTDAPQGMTIDQNGLIRWTFGKDYKGTVQAKVKVTDGQGGEVTQSLTFSIGN
jgi:hypothetical protein